MRDRKLYHKLNWFDCLLAALSGLLLILAFPRPAFYPIAWCGLVPLLLAIRGTNAKGSLSLGLIAGVIFFGGLMYWIALFGYLPWLLLGIFQAVFIAAFAILANLVYRNGWLPVLIIPAVWTAVEWTRSLGTFGLTWGGLAYSQAHWPAILRIACITGAWGVTYLIVLVNAAIAELAARRNGRSLAWLGFSILLVIASTLTPGRINDRPDARTMRVAMVQGGIDLTWPDPSLRERLHQTYWSMTREMQPKPDLVVWPESALPGDLLSEPPLQAQLTELAQETESCMLVGGLHDVADASAPGGYREYNGAYLYDRSGRLIDTYYKNHLVPFGEFVPGRSWLPFLDNYRVNAIDRYPGNGYKPLKASNSEIGVMICFESIFPSIARKLTERGAETLIVITNDSWFGKTAAAAQHHDFAILRAVESNRYVLRNASTGITSIISPSGKILDTAGLGKQAIVEGNIPLLARETFYVRFGDWFAVLCGICSVALLAGAVRAWYKATGRP